MWDRLCHCFFLWIVPLLLLWITRQQQWTEPSTEPTTLSFNASSVYLVISKPQNLISLHVIEQLQPATVLVVYPPSEEHTIPMAQRRLPESVKWCCYDPFGDPANQCKTAVLDCLDVIPQKIDGVLFNTYGAVGDGTLHQHSRFVQYKLIGNLSFLHKLVKEGRLQDGARIIFVGSESARGLPKMGFQVPNLGTSIESIQSYLTGAAYSTGDISLYRWEQAYADLCAILVLYVKHLSTSYPDYYFGIISPGMTEESLNPNNTPNPSWSWRIQMWSFRYIFFSLLKHWEIAKPSREGAWLLTQALRGDWDYPSGAFVGAKSGTGGPLCDQSTLKGGKMFLNERLQQIVHQAVQPFVVQ